MRDFLQRAVALGALVLLSGCGYTFRTTLDEGYQTIHVEPFGNYSAEYDLQAPLTNAVVRKFMNDARLRVTDAADADLVLEGAILDYERKGSTFSDDEPANLFTELEVQVEVYNHRTNEVLWSDEITGESSFFSTSRTLPVSRLRGNAEVYTIPVRSFRTNEENQAASEIIEDIASKILLRTVEPW